MHEVVNQEMDGTLALNLRITRGFGEGPKITFLDTVEMKAEIVELE